MIEVRGDFFEIAESLSPETSAICVTTNGCVKANGELVMGAGIAKAFAERWRGLPKEMGQQFSRYGLHTRVTANWPMNDTDEVYMPVVMLPTKLGMTRMTEELQYLVPKGKFFPNGTWVQGWMLNSPPDLVRRSCQELVELANENEWEKVLLTRPGCGNGGLKWEEVQSWLSSMFDDRFVIVHNGK